MNVYACSDIGRVRTGNQDAYIVQPLGTDDQATLLIVADGMGGTAGGEVASQLAVQIVCREVSSAYESWAEAAERIEGLRRAVHNAHDAVKAKQLTAPALGEMGTTFTAVLAMPEQLFVVHTGDSRAYLIKAGNAHRLTDDHSVVGELVRCGTLTEEEARQHPQRHVVTSALGTHGPLQLDAQITDWDEGDVLLLCSDGLSNLISDAELVTAVAEGVADLPQRLVGLANQRGGTDNITVLVARHRPPPERMQP